MKKGFVYTVAFMVILSALLTFALAFSYEAFKPSIAAHKQLRGRARRALRLWPGHRP